MESAIQQLHTQILGALFPAAVNVIPLWVTWCAAALAGAAVMVAWMSVMAMAWTYLERRIAGWIQHRMGPNRTGPYGLLQPIVDGLKLLLKEDIMPTGSNRFMFTLAPLLVFLGAMIPFVAIPFSERLVLANMKLGLYYILAFEAIEVIGVLMAGWAPGSKWSLYGGMRLAAQMISYEIPMGLCVLVIVMLAGSLNLAEIVNWQSQNAFGLSHPWIFGWAIFRSPAALVAFVIFYIGGLASAKRAPFDLPEAESELVAGYHTEYSGMRFAYFFMAEYAAMYVICAVAAIIFLGGWHGPIPRPEVAASASVFGQWAHNVAQLPAAADLSLLGKLSALVSTFFGAIFHGDGARILLREIIGTVNLLMKAFGLYFIMIWVRWTLPRVRIDQVMYLCLKVLLPFALACVIWTLIQVIVL